MSYYRPVHRINGQGYTVAFVAGNYFYLRRESDGALFRTGAVELRSRMYLEPVKETS